MKKNIYSITFMVLIIDLFLKQIVLNNVKSLPLTVIPSFFSISYVENTGGAWGILGNSTWILTLLSVLVVILLNQYLLKKEKYTKLEVISYGLFMGGLLGNLVDRLVYGHVIDYLDFTIFSYSYPVFNVADIALVVGVFLLVIELIRSERNESKSRKK